MEECFLCLCSRYPLLNIINNKHVYRLIEVELMGIQFWELALWVSYLIVATPMRGHNTLAEPNADAMDDNNETEEQH